MTRVGFVLIALAGACSVQSGAELYSDEKDPPIRMAPAGATAEQYTGAFKALCLDNFPNQEAMKATAAKLGFRKTEHVTKGVVGGDVDLEVHESRSLKLFAQFGENELVWDGLSSGGSLQFHTCRLHGHVIDPQNLTGEVVRAAYNSTIEFSDTEDDQRRLKGTIATSGNDTQATLELPYIYSVDADSHIVGSDRCGDLPSCRVWREVEFELFRPEEGAQVP